MDLGRSLGLSPWARLCMIKRLVVCFGLLLSCPAPVRGIPHSAFCTTGAGTQLSGISDRGMSKKASPMDSASAATTTKDGIMLGQSAWFQKTITVKAPSRGCHLITDQIYEQCPEMRKFAIGTAQIFIKHTSASLTINENADPDVRVDMEAALNRIVPESWNSDLFRHTDEGPDDMPGHVKSTLIGATVNVPISGGRMALGTWQGIYLCEHRNTGGWGGGHQRKIVITINGLVNS